MNVKRQALFLTFCAAAGILLTASAQARPGDLDPLFGLAATDSLPGMVILPLPFPELYPEVSALAVQPDGGVVLVAVLQNPPFTRLARLLPDGTPAAAFGRDFNGVGVTAMALLANGGALLAGYRKNGVYDIATLLRLSPSGEPEEFAGEESLAIGFGFSSLGWSSRASAVMVLPDGKILVAGGTVQKLAVMRLLEDGTPDPAFGAGGLITGPGNWVLGMTLQEDGKLVICSSEGDFTANWIPLMRFLDNGAPDPSFGAGGILNIAAPQGVDFHPSGVAVLNDGKILVAASALNNTWNYDILLARVEPGGIPDTSFHGTGRVYTDVTALTVGHREDALSKDTATDLCVQPDGKILVSGVSNESAALVRYLPDGALDTGFGSGGIVLTRGTGSRCYASSMALQPDGKILTGGFADEGLAVIRYQGEEPAPGAGMSAEVDGAVLVSGQRMEFGTALGFNPPREKVITLRNTGSVPLTKINARVLDFSKTGHFTVDPPSATELDAGASATLTVRFSPARGIGDWTDAVIIESAVPGTNTGFRLHGVIASPVATLALSQDQLTLQPNATMDFGGVMAGQSDSRVFTLSNAGNIDLTIQGITLGAAGTPGDFTAGPPETELLGPGASTTFPVTFTPLGPGPRTARLRIASTDTFNPPWEINLTGTLARDIEGWRFIHFGSPSNTGPGADLADPDEDGIPNLLEYATATDPNHKNPPDGELVKKGYALEYTIHRIYPATDLNYSLEWSDAPNLPWRSDFVSMDFISSDGTVQQVKYTLSAGTEGHRFVRLRVTRL